MEKQITHIRMSTLFAVLWACATLFHLASYRLWAHSGIEVALALSAFWLLLSPNSLWRLVVLAVLQLIAVWDVLPRIANHWLVTGFINLTLLVAIASVALKRQPLSGFFEKFAPAARVQLLILWFMAAFHKLNTDYFVAATSCASIHYLELAKRLSFLPTTLPAQNFMIYVSILTEAGIPVLLIFRKTRILGIFVGCSFHFLLGLSPFGDYYNFSAMLFALYFLFAPENYPELLVTWWKKHPVSTKVASRTLQYGLVLGIAAAIAIAVLLQNRSRLISDVLRFAPLGAWLVYGLVMMVIFFLSIHSSERHQTPARVLLKPAGVTIPIIALMFLNGLSPYLGIKTEMSYSMFSNLRTEQDRSNHFLIRHVLHLNGLADDVVTILHSSDPRIQHYADDGFGITLFELRSYVSTHKEISLSYVRNGVRHDLARAGDDPELARPIPVLQRKLLSFRPVTLRDAVGCQH
jgi:hypothetical protein